MSTPREWPEKNVPAGGGDGQNRARNMTQILDTIGAARLAAIGNRIARPHPTLTRISTLFSPIAFAAVCGCR